MVALCVRVGFAMCILVAVVGCGKTGTDQGTAKGGLAVAVPEAYILDIVVLDESNRRLNAVMVGVRTEPAADSLTFADVELVARDGTTCQPEYGGAQQIGKEHWFVFAVPSKQAEAGGMQLRMKSNGQVAPLPKKLQGKSTNDLEKR